MVIYFKFKARFNSRDFLGNTAVLRQVKLAAQRLRNAQSWPYQRRQTQYSWTSCHERAYKYLLPQWANVLPKFVQSWICVWMTYEIRACHPHKPETWNKNRNNKTNFKIVLCSLTGAGGKRSLLNNEFDKNFVSLEHPKRYLFSVLIWIKVY